MISNASGRQNIADVNQIRPSGYDHKQTQLEAQKLAQMRGARDNQDEDLRSVRSEIDYANKKNFTDMLGEPSKAQQLARLANEFQGN